MSINHEYGRVAQGVITKDRAAEILEAHNQKIEAATRAVVMAATEALDVEMMANFRLNTKRSEGPCGDRLAGQLHELIQAAIEEQLTL